MKRVFADTFFFMAVLNRRDAAHPRAIEAYGHADYEFVTTEWVLTEVADAAASPALRQGFKEFFQLLENDEKVEIIPASHERFRSGLKLYFERPDKEWSLTDCISFVVMQESDITDALTGDHHFEQAGFVALLK